MNITAASRSGITIRFALSGALLTSLMAFDLRRFGAVDSHAIHNVVLVLVSCCCCCSCSCCCTIVRLVRALVERPVVAQLRHVVHVNYCDGRTTAPHTHAPIMSTEHYTSAQILHYGSIVNCAQTERCTWHTHTHTHLCRWRRQKSLAAHSAAVCRVQNNLFSFVFMGTKALCAKTTNVVLRWGGWMSCVAAAAATATAKEQQQRLEEGARTTTLTHT